MPNILQNLAGMGGMTDQVIATDCLVSAKCGVINTSIALTEAATPALRDTLRVQLNDSIDTHERISNYMISKGFYHPHGLDEQIQVDVSAAKTAENLAERKLK